MLPPFTPMTLNTSSLKLTAEPIYNDTPNQFILYPIMHVQSATTPLVQVWLHRWTPTNLSVFLSPTKVTMNYLSSQNVAIFQ